MIDESWRYFTYGGVITPGGPSRWDVLDFDQRRTISVNLPNEEYDDDIAISTILFSSFISHTLAEMRAAHGTFQGLIDLQVF